MQKRLLFIILALAGGWNSHAQHGHLNVGALGTNQNDRLFFANGAEFAEATGYVKTLVPATAGRFAGYYEGNITLTALPGTSEHAGPDPDAAALGSYVQFTMTLVSGPAGGSFGFWEATSTSPVLSLLPGETSTNLFPLTEGDGSAGSDPYGHIHGRRFTATKPGIYQMAFQAWDTSKNGSSGGPIHTPSEVLVITFQAGYNIASITRTGGVASVRFGSAASQVFTLEYSTNIVETNLWIPIAGPRAGNDHFQIFEDLSAAEEARFYRLKAEPFIP